MGFEMGVLCYFFCELCSVLREREREREGMCSVSCVSGGNSSLEMGFELGGSLLFHL